MVLLNFALSRRSYPSFTIELAETRLKAARIAIKAIAKTDKNAICFLPRKTAGLTRSERMNRSDPARAMLFSANVKYVMFTLFFRPLSISRSGSDDCRQFLPRPAEPAFCLSPFQHYS